MLSFTEEAIIVAFREHTLLPLDDYLYGLQPTVPHLTRSSLHRCLQRHSTRRLPEVTGDKPATKKIKAYPIDYFHIDIAEVHIEEGGLYLFVAIDRMLKFAFAQLHEKATRRVAGDLLRALIAVVPYKIHTVLTDNGTHFTTPGSTSSAAPLIKEAIEQGEIFRAYSFELARAQNDIDHRLTKPRQPWATDVIDKRFRIQIPSLPRRKITSLCWAIVLSRPPRFQLNPRVIWSPNGPFVTAGRQVERARIAPAPFAYMCRNKSLVRMSAPCLRA